MPARNAGMAKPDKQVHSVCPYCGVGCGVAAGVKDAWVIGDGLREVRTALVEGRETTTVTLPPVAVPPVNVLLLIALPARSLTPLIVKVKFWPLKPLVCNATD